MKHVRTYNQLNENVGLNYGRVVPRDLFNESKLLKCIGQLCLLIHNNDTPVEMSFEHNRESFKIELLMEGSLTITNVIISIKNKPYMFKTTYNSKSNYPLFVVDGYDEYPVFDNNGEFDEEFIEFCNKNKK
jgi:hypothetical protein